VTGDASFQSDVAAALLLEKLIRNVYAARLSAEIQPLQWSILRYLKTAPENRCTVGWIRSFVGLTHAPVVRAIKTLTLRGLVADRNHPQDARSRLLYLTASGLDSLRRDPILSLVRLMRELPENDRVQLKKSIRTLALGADIREEIDEP